MAAPFSTNLTMYRGQSLQIQTVLTNPPSSWTGYDLVFMAKAAVTDADSNAVVTKKYSSSQITIGMAGSNQALFTTILTADTRALPATVSVLTWEIKSVDPTGQEIPLDGGTLTVYPDIAASTT